MSIAAYAVISNHYHLVLHINQAKADALTDDEVIERWLMLFKAPILIQRYKAGSLWAAKPSGKLYRILSRPGVPDYCLLEIESMGVRLLMASAY